MSDVVKLRISSVVAVFVRPGATLETRLSGIQAVPGLEPPDQVTLLFCLGRDPDAAVKDAARAAFARLPENILLAYVGNPDAHPALLGEIARMHGANAAIAGSLLMSPGLPAAARDHLKNLHSPPVEEPAAEPSAEPEELAELPDISADPPPPEEFSDQDVSELSEDSGEGDAEEDYADFDENDEEYLSKYKLIQIMGISEKIKMALTGDKEWRAILVKDANKLVSGSVLKNPRITEPEVLRIIKMGVQSDEVIRIICANREWIKNYQIRKALIDCPKTPLANSLRYLGLLHEKDLASYAKSRNVSSVISTQAKRMILQKQKKR